MCLYKLSKRKKANEPITCYKVMNLIDGKNIVVNSLIHPKGSGYSVGDTIHASEKLSRYKFINCWKIDRLDELTGEVVHSYAHSEDVNMYMSGTRINRFTPYWWSARYLTAKCIGREICQAVVSMAVCRSGLKRCILIFGRYILGYIM